MLSSMNLKMFEDDDRIVDDDADHQHQREHRDGIEREAERRHQPERRDHRRWNGDGGNDGRRQSR